MAAAQPTESTIDPEAALAEALSALDRAAKVGAIHPNAAARRKSRLTRKINAALGGEHVQSGGRVVKTTGKAAAAKAAKARIAAGKAGKAKGAQTAAGKARAALSKTARAEAAAAKAAAEASATTAAVAPAAKAATTKATDEAHEGDRDQGDRDQGRSEEGHDSGHQGRTEGDRQGGAQGEEGHDQGIAQASRRTDDAPVRPGRFNSGALEPGAAVGRTSRRPAPASSTPPPASGGRRRTAPRRPGPDRRHQDERAGRPDLLGPVEARERRPRP